MTEDVTSRVKEIASKLTTGIDQLDEEEIWKLLDEYFTKLSDRVSVSYGIFADGKMPQPVTFPTFVSFLYSVILLVSAQQRLGLVTKFTRMSDQQMRVYAKFVDVLTKVGVALYKTVDPLDDPQTYFSAFDEILRSLAVPGNGLAMIFMTVVGSVRDVAMRHFTEKAKQVAEKKASEEKADE